MAGGSTTRLGSIKEQDKLLFKLPVLGCETVCLFISPLNRSARYIAAQPKTCAGFFESRLTLTKGTRLLKHFFFLSKKRFTPQTFGVVGDYYSLKLKGKQYKQIT